MRVLVIDGVGPFGGASRSLYEVLRALPKGSAELLFIGTLGTSLDYYREVATDLIATRGLTRFDNTRYSHYRGVRWLVVLRELLHLPFTVAAIARARRRWGHVDAIHANEVTEIIPALLARWVFGAPLVVHVRSPQRADARSWRTRWLHRRLRRSVEAVIAIDQNVRSTLPAALEVDVIHNSFSPEPAVEPDRALESQLAALRPGSLKVGFVGNLHRSKGLFDLLEAARIVRDRGADVDFVVVGGATRSEGGLRGWLLRRAGLAQDALAEVQAEIAGLGLEDRFHLLGHSADIARAYARFDVLCFPSHFDAPGRPVFEAAFLGVPAIVAVTDPRPDTLVPGETGLAIPGADPLSLAGAIMYFSERREEVARMGANAKSLATRNFVPGRNAGKLLAVYKRVASPGSVREAPDHQLTQ
jgi:glycosyltransferase involved in cell wall biosynthesis